MNFKNHFVINKNNTATWEVIFLSALFLAQLFIIAYFNLTMLGTHMGYDSSWSYLKSALLWEEKALNSPIWTDQTNTFLDSSVLLAALLYGITGKLLISYGIANMIVLILLLVCMWKILTLLSVGRIAKLVAINMIICPYLTNGFSIINDLGYFNDILSGPAFYNVRTLLILLIVYEFIYIKQNNKINIWGYFSLLLCALAGASSGIFILVMSLFPYIAYEIELTLIKNDWNQLKTKESLYAYLGCVSVICGKLYATHILEITISDSERTWTTLENLWTNLGAVIQGLMKLLGVLPIHGVAIPILSTEGIYRLFPIIIFVIILFSLGFAIKQIKHNFLHNDELLLFLLNIIGINFIMFSLFHVQYGSAIFEERYLISTFMIVIILVAYYLNQLDNTKIFSRLVLWGMIAALLGNNYVSDKRYIHTTNDSWQMQELTTIINSQNADLVYFWGDDIYVIGRAMRAYDLDHVYKEIMTNGEYHHWGDYLYYENNEDYAGGTILVIPRGSSIVPANIMEQYSHLQDLNLISVYYCDHNPVDIYSGITGDISIDYPSSKGIYVQFGDFEGTSYITNGTAGYVMWGPYCPTPSGTYDFIIDYQILDCQNEKGASFDVALDIGTISMGIVSLDKNSTQAKIADVTLTDGHSLEYRVFCEEGTIIRINKVTILKK